VRCAPDSRGNASAGIFRLGNVDRKVSEAIDIYDNRRRVARGEVFLVKDKLGVTMTEIIKADIDNILTPDGARLDTSRGAVGYAELAARQVTGNLVGRTVAEVERELILDTLKDCLGNRTHAANILGISIRTLRNKLNEYAADGAPIPPAGGDEARRGAP
jgi:hypothetical protein